MELHSPNLRSVINIIKEQSEKDTQERDLAKKEKNREFPFTMFNPFKVFIDYAVCFLHEFMDAYDSVREETITEIILNSFESPTRMIRYLRILVLGAYLDTLMGSQAKIDFLDDVSRIFKRKTEADIRMTRRKSTEIYEGFPCENLILDLNTKRALAELAVSLTEYADYLFLSEHPVSCRIYGPFTADDHKLLTREFSYLNFRGFLRGIQKLELHELYTSSAQILVDVHRGSLLSIPPFWEKQGARIVIDGNSIIVTRDTIERLLSGLENAMYLARKFYSGLSERDLELEFAYIYSWPIINLRMLRGEEWHIPSYGRDSIVQGATSRAVLVETKGKLYSQIYLGLLMKSLEKITRDCFRTSHCRNL